MTWQFIGIEWYRDALEGVHAGIEPMTSGGNAPIIGKQIATRFARK